MVVQNRTRPYLEVHVADRLRGRDAVLSVVFQLNVHAAQADGLTHHDNRVTVVVLHGRSAQVRIPGLTYSDANQARRETQARERLAL